MFVKMFILSKLLQGLSAQRHTWQYVYTNCLQNSVWLFEEGGEVILHHAKICSPKSCSVMFVTSVIPALRTGWPLKS